MNIATVIQNDAISTVSISSTFSSVVPVDDTGGAEDICGCGSGGSFR